MARRLLLIALVLSALAGSLSAATYHVDAINGNDTTGNGSQAAPYATIARVRPALVGGDVVILYDGNYGAINERTSGSPSSIFSDWVTFRAAEGASPQIEHVWYGANGGSFYGTENRGSFDAYMRFEGIHILDGIQSYGARHIAFYKCLIERYPPWTGSVADIEKVAAGWRGGTDILIEDCEITNTGVGIGGPAHEVRIIGNHIHHGSHDGIRVTGWWNSLIEGNVIHNFDDGVTDAEATWSRHCDLIHIFVPGPDVWYHKNSNVVIRSNVLYDAEAQIVQFNNYGTTRNELIRFENNIFGPGHAPMFNNADGCDGLVIRHNTVAYIPGGRVFNRWLCNNYTLRISAGSTGVEIYNNILGSAGIEAGAGVNVFDWNLFQIASSPIGVDNSRAFGRFTLNGVDPLFDDVDAFNGRLLSNSPAINAGTSLFAPDPVYPWDYEGTPRDLRPDLGAYELRGQSPVAEEPLPEYPGLKTYFVDDFEDGHYADVDPWLDGPGRQGMSWHRPDDAQFKYYITNTTLLDRNALFEPTGTSGVQRVCWLFSDQGSDWVDYTFDFKAWNSYLVLGGGPVVLAIDQRNCYWLDISRDNGRLVRYMDEAQGNPTETELARSAAIELPHYGSLLYRVHVSRTAAGITIAVDVGANGSIQFAVTDTDPLAIQTFIAGGVGFHGDVLDQYHKICYDNIAVSVSRFLDEAAPQIARWDIIEPHGAAGDIAIETVDGYVASSLGGVRTLRVVFDEAVDPATVSAAAVAILGHSTGDVSSLISAVALNSDNTEMTITLSGPLPDADRYILTLAPTVADPSGNPLAGNRDRVLIALAGDVNSSLSVTGADQKDIRSHVGTVDPAALARYDINGSGEVTAADLLGVRPLLGHTAP